MDTSKWKWFRYDEIFDIKKGKRLTKENMIDGNIRYIGAIDSNNGLSSLIGNDSQLHKGNTISVSYNGSIGYAFYQDKEFWATDDVNVLYPKFTLNAYLALYLCTLIEKEQYRFCYGRKWDLEMMNKSQIKLLVTPEGTPDWQFMETFVKDQIIPQLPKKAQKVWLQKYDTKPQQNMKMQLNTDEWKWFRYDEIFDIRHGFYNKKPEDNPKGDIPFIGATDSNNGVTSHSDIETIESTSQTGEGYNASLDEKLYKTPCITVSNDGSVGYAFYQNRDFTCSHSVNPLYLKNHVMNEYIAIFLCTLIEKERFRWAYGRKWRPIRMPSSKIKLPVTPEGTPDWQFMEDYIKSLPYSKNIAPSDPKEVVDELVEMKKEMIKMRRAMEAQQSGTINNFGTVNIYEK
ncbi:MAG: restriction endonuclease subunit S [Paludibacteraceae bacterium]|nr:restriction endonuclease subunit S [Paludibacteraceae bacterium]